MRRPLTLQRYYPLAYLTTYVRTCPAAKSHDWGVKSPDALKPAASVVASRLRQARVLRDLTQEQLGVRLGLDEGVAAVRISRYESGKHAPPWTVMQRIADILDVPIGYFVTEDEQLSELLMRLHRAPQQVLERILDALRSEPGG